MDPSNYLNLLGGGNQPNEGGMGMINLLGNGGGMDNGGLSNGAGIGMGNMGMGGMGMGLGGLGMGMAGMGMGMTGMGMAGMGMAGMGMAGMGMGGMGMGMGGMGMGMGGIMDPGLKTSVPLRTQNTSGSTSVPSAAAGSAQQLTLQSEKDSKKRKIATSSDDNDENGDDEHETEDTGPSALKFSKYLESLKEKKPRDEKADESSGESSEEDASKKRKGKKGKSKGKEIGRPAGSRNSGPLKKDMEKVIEEQKKTIKNLKKRVDELEKENTMLKMEMKKAKQSVQGEEIITISEGEDDAMELPMSFQWNETANNRTSHAGTIPPPETEDASDVIGNDGFPQYNPDDYLTDEEDSAAAAVPVKGEVDLEVGNLKVPCKACLVEEAVFRITKCDHFGFCIGCKVRYHGTYGRCSGCGEWHIIMLKKMYI